MKIWDPADPGERLLGEVVKVGQGSQTLLILDVKGEQVSIPRISWQLVQEVGRHELAPGDAICIKYRGRRFTLSASRAEDFKGFFVDVLSR